MSLDEISNKRVRNTISENNVQQKLVQQTYLLKDKESYIMATSEIEGAHVLPRDTTPISNEFQQVLRGVGH